LAAVALLGGALALATMLPLAYAVQVAPSVWSAYRAYTPTGIAAATWVLVGFEALLWGLYGWAHDDPATRMFAVVGSLAAAAILARKLATRRRVALA
jgi:hypothetical protein